MNFSIGLIDEVYYDSRNNRTKAFVTTLLTSVKEVGCQLDSFLAQARGSRLSLRLVVRGVEDNRLRTLTRPHIGQMMTCEAIVPVDRLGTKIVYYGWNDGTRMTSFEYRVQEENLFREIAQRSTPRRHSSDNFVVEFSKQKENWNEDDVKRLLDIYQRAFSGYLLEFNLESVRNMLRSNWVSLVRDRETFEIVAVAMGETAVVTVEGRPVSICELSEVATWPDVQRRGLAHLAFGRLCEELKIKKVAVVFTETRAASYGMTAIAHDFGFCSCGRLEQHCVISSPYSEVAQDGAYGDLIVFALPPCD